MKKLSLILISIVMYLTIHGQDFAPVTTKIFVEGVHITTAPSVDSYFGHVLIEDGIITRIGPEISPPFDARVIQGDSMYAYAGFIATASHIGLKAPKKEEEKKPDRPGYPSEERAGITPGAQAKDQYVASDKSIDNFRKAGFTIAHALPHGRMLPGMGTIFSLNGKEYTEAVIKEDHAMYAQWSTARGVFPSTLIGIMAKWRELYKNAQLAEEHQKRYIKDARHLNRPTPTAAEAALAPVTTGQMPVYFKSEKGMDVSRALILQRELGFDLTLAEVKDADRFIKKLKNTNTKVLVSLDLPDEMKEKKKKADGDEGDKGAENKKEDVAADNTLEAMKSRKKEAINRYIDQAKALSAAGIPISFSYLEVKPADIHPNIRRMVKNGLNSSKALAALTTDAALQLGISQIAGTLESGKMGHIVLMSMPLDSAKAKVKMVLVDGDIHTYTDQPKKKDKVTDGPQYDISGTWSYVISIPGMEPSGTMIINQDDDNYTIIITSDQSPGDEMEAKDISRTGNQMSFTFDIDEGGETVTVFNDLTFEEDQMEGKVSVADFGTFDITGTKNSPE